MQKIGIIGGTGLLHMPGLAIRDTLTVETPYGATSSTLTTGLLNSVELVFLARHGNPHRLPPHKINYRANLWALQNVGVDHIIAVNAVGGIHPKMGPGHINIPDQIVDYTYGREHTFSDSTEVPLHHIDFTFPYNRMLRTHIASAAKKLKLNFSDTGVYAATQGPRLESPAEINRLERDGCDIVGMTGMPEAALARELGLFYASIALVVNMAAGRSETEITMADIERVLATGMQDVLKLIECSLDQLSA